MSTPTTKLLHSSSKARQSHIAFYCVYRSVRVHIRTDGDFTREVDDDVQRIRVYFSTNPQIVNESNGFDLASVISDLNVAVDNFNRRGSGFVLESIKHFVICITQYRPLHGGSSYIPTPQWLKNKRCVINIENGQTQNVSSGAYWRTFISRSTIKSGYTITKGTRTR